MKFVIFFQKAGLLPKMLFVGLMVICSLFGSINRLLAETRYESFTHWGHDYVCSFVVVKGSFDDWTDYTPPGDPCYSDWYLHEGPVYWDASTLGIQLGSGKRLYDNCYQDFTFAAFHAYGITTSGTLLKIKSRQGYATPSAWDSVIVIPKSVSSTSTWLRDQGYGSSCPVNISESCSGQGGKCDTTIDLNQNNGPDDNCEG